MILKANIGFGLGTIILYTSVIRLMLVSDLLAACRIAALMMILVQLRKHHLPQRDDNQAASGACAAVQISSSKPAS